MNSPPDSGRSALEDTHGPAEWSLLRPHASRNALLRVDPSLDLMVVARAIAEDNTEAVAGWLSKQALRRPTPQEIAEWDAIPSKTFETVVVAPYVLMKELSS